MTMEEPAATHQRRSSGALDGNDPDDSYPASSLNGGNTTRNEQTGFSCCCDVAVNMAEIHRPRKRITFPAGVIGSERLCNTLATLEATSLVCVYTKTMVASDRDYSQNRLLISCKNKEKNGEDKQSLFANVFTEEEKLKVHRQDKEPTESEEEKIGEEGCDKEHDNNRKKHGKNKSKKRKRDRNKNKNKGEDENPEEETNDEKQQQKDKEEEKGLSVRAYDRDGREYDLRWRFLNSNSAYRIIGRPWKLFLQNNSLIGGIERQKRRKISPGEDGGESPITISSSPEEEANGEHQERYDADVVRIQLWAFRSRKLEIGEDGHPDGALGLVLLHHREGEDAQPVFAEEDMDLDAHGNTTSIDADIVHDKGMTDVAGKPDEPAPWSVAREARLSPVEVFRAQSLLLLKVRDCKEETQLDAANCVCKQGSDANAPVLIHSSSVGAQVHSASTDSSVPNMNW